jgi:predicted PurR-regulated permease PerM
VFVGRSAHVNHVARLVAAVGLGLLVITLLVGPPIFLAAAGVRALVDGRWLLGAGLVAGAGVVYAVIHHVVVPHVLKRSESFTVGER